MKIWAWLYVASGSLLLLLPIPIGVILLEMPGYMGRAIVVTIIGIFTLLKGIAELRQKTVKGVK